MALQYIDRGNYNVVVVGAASGIGLQAARFLSGQGVRIAALDRNKDGAEATAKELGGKSIARAVDVADWDAVQSTIDGIAQEFGVIDALVNCAGITGKTNVPTHEVDIDDFDAVYRIT